MAQNVTLKVDGENISLSDYPESVVFAVTVALAGTLHGIGEDWKRMEIVLER